MKTKICIAIVVACMLGFCASPAEAQYGGGSGTAEDPYLIYTAEQMNAIGVDPNDWDKHYRLMADIDLQAYLGTDFNIIGTGAIVCDGYGHCTFVGTPFTGTFDGNGFAISNFTYTSATADFTDCIGLFGVVDGENAEIKNLGLIDPNINVHLGDRIGSLIGLLASGTVTGCYAEGGRVSGDYRVGGLVGQSGSSVSISNCYAASNISGEGEIGGLVGSTYYGIISSCYSSGNINGTGFFIGGLVGGNYYGTILNCYSTGSVLGHSWRGGLVGENRGPISNCYATGSVPGIGGHLGGFVGYNSSSVTNSFWDVNSSGADTSAGGTGQTTAEMQDPNTFVDAGWDFTTPIWKMCEVPDYPKLWWEECPEPVTYYVNAAEGSDNNDGLSPETPFATIQKAIDSAFDGDTVLVADGTYTGPGNRDIDFKGKAITVRSENGPENCIIDCQGAEEDQHRGFYFHSGEKPSSTIHGFTITGGFAKNTQPDPPWPYPPLTKYGGGIYCKWACPTITNCVVSGNLADSGGGICVDNLPGWPPFNPTIANCLISGNSATRDGGGIYCTPGTIVENCTIFGNRAAKAGGGYCSRSSSDLPPEYEGSLPPSGPEYDSEIINCIFFDNLSNQGPQIAAGSPQTSPPTPPPPWPPPWWPGFGNYPTEVLSEQTDTNLPVLSVKYSDIQGGQDGLHVGYDRDLKWGQGNIDLDPCFVEPGYWADANDPNIIVEPNDPNAVWIDGDYYLLPDSLCIDAGDPNYVPEPDETDIDGNPRVSGDVIDMGAYEAMVSCFGVNHVKLGTKAGKKGNKVEVKGTFDPASPIDFAVDDVMYTIDDGLDYMLTFIIPAGSFEAEGKPEKQKFKFDSPKHSQPDIKARFDFLKCEFELKVKGVIDTSEITAETLAIVLQAGANIAQEIVELEVKGKKGEHLEYKRKPKFECCPEM